MNNSDLRTLSAIPRPSQDAILFATIGGVAEIGMNWTLYGANDQFVLVDAGTTFAPRDVAGVEAVMPDPKIFRPLGRRLKGLLVTTSTRITSAPYTACGQNTRVAQSTRLCSRR